MGLRKLITDLESNKPFGASYPLHNTPASNAGFDYGESISIFDTKTTNNDYFPFKQRSLGYGPQGTKDSTGMFGRVYGPAPYRKQQLPDLDKTFKPSSFGNLVDSVTDVGIRGGLLTATKRSLQDSLRIGEFMLSAKGLGFIAKNVGLQRTNPKLQEGAGLLGRNRLYNLGVNTLAQVAVNFTGLHINRAGLLPIGKANYRVEQGYRVDTDNDTKYEYNVRGTEIYQEGGTGNIGYDGPGGNGSATNPFDVYTNNRLIALWNKLVDPKMGTYNTEPELYEFSGGPHSVYGLGSTRLKRYVFTNRSVEDYHDQMIDDPAYISSKHLGDREGPEPGTGILDVVDFRKNRGVPYTKYNQKLGDTGTKLHQKFGYIGAVPIQYTDTATFDASGNLSKSRINIPANDDGTINIKVGNPFRDAINSTDITTHTGPFDKTDAGTKYRDFIKFRIEAVNTDDPTYSDTMVFRAFLDSMGDDYSSKWTEYNYNGRAESFHTFAGFNRSISFSFKVAAFSREEMKPLYRKLNYLVSQTAGEYHKTRLRGNFCRLTIGDYFSRVPGFFTGIGLKWAKDYPWEIALNTKGIGNNMDEDMNELPHILDVSCKFQPVHDFIPQKSINDSPFIIPHKYSKQDITDEQAWYTDDPVSQDELNDEAAQRKIDEAKEEEEVVTPVVPVVNADEDNQSPEGFQWEEGFTGPGGGVLL